MKMIAYSCGPVMAELEISEKEENSSEKEWYKKVSAGTSTPLHLTARWFGTESSPRQFLVWLDQDNRVFY